MRSSATRQLALTAVAVTLGCEVQPPVGAAACSPPPPPPDTPPNLPICDSVDQGDCIGEMVRIPAGYFARGCNEPAEDCDEDEYPQSIIGVLEFAIDRTEITVGQYRACVDSGYCRPPRCLADYTAEEAQAWTEVCTYFIDGANSLPMTCLSWFDASSYCAWAGKRLPTEAEWEKAARGGCEFYGNCLTGTPPYPWGTDAPTCEHCVMREGGPGCGTNFVLPVGQRLRGASPYGILDMSGNVWEWNQDVYLPYPADGTIGGQVDAPASVPRVLRGGDYLYGVPQDMRAANRDLDYPISSHTSYGARCARSL